MLCYAMSCYAYIFVYIQSYVRCAIYIADALQTASADDS